MEFRIERLVTAWRRTIAAAVGWRERLALSWLWVGGLAAAAAVMAGLAVTLGKTMEDVSALNGWQNADLGEVQSVAAHRSGALISVALMLTRLGGVPVLLGIGVIAAALLWWRGERLFVACAPVAAVASAGAAVAAGKLLFDRARPPASLRLVAESDASFPSGHSGDSAAFFITLALIIAAVIAVRWSTRIITLSAGLVTVAGIGASRVVLGAHYPTDVIAGWCIGALIAGAVSVAVLLARRYAGAIGPGEGQPRMVRFGLAVITLSRRPDHPLALATQ